MSKLIDLGNAVAVVGMTGRFPGARNVEELWRNLRDGVDSVCFFEPEELQALGVSPALIANPAYVPAAAQPPDLDRFDAGFFGINHREAEILDPQQRVFLETCWEALEDAGYDPDDLTGTVTGVFAGQTTSTYLIFNLIPSLMGTMDPLQLLVGNAGDSLATRVSYKLNLKGPSFTVQSACSSSAVAVHTACQSLLNGECDLALAGGVSINVHLLHGYKASEGSVFAKSGKCRAFDAGAEGILFGGGAGVVVLKRAEEALRDGDNVQALILGSAVNNDGSMKVGYTAPSVDGQAEVISEAWAAAGVEMETASYIEAHGTGTSLGDPIEIQALTKAFPRKLHIPIGSVKTNIGHLDVAAGIAGLIKTILALKHREIPPSLHFAEPNPEIDFANSPVYVNTELRPWEGSPRRAGVSSFGFGGTNVHLVLQEAPQVVTTQAQQERRRLQVSARSEEALEIACQRLADHLESHPELDLADVEYTLRVGRRTFEHKRVVECRNCEEAIERLRRPSPPSPLSHPHSLPPGRGGDLLSGVWGRPSPGGPGVRMGEGTGVRVSLPTYPFERHRYWIDPPGVAVPEAAPSVVEEAPSAVLAMAAGAVQTFHPRPALFNPYEPPRDEREETVCRIWSEVLGVEPVGVHDDFFQLGGHSLLATQILSRVRDAFEVDFPLQHLFSFPTAAELADAIGFLQEESVEERESQRIPVSPLRSLSGKAAGPYPMSFPQERLWFLDQLTPGTPAFNVPAAVRLRGRADVPVLRWSLDQVVARHESLRTRFTSTGYGAVQEVLPPFPVPMPVADLSALPPAARQAEQQRLTLAESFFSFRIATGPLLRALLVRLAPEDHLLLLVVHHIVTDGWSMNVFQRDFARFYQAALSGRRPALPELEVQYGDFADWQRQRYTGEVLDGLLAYWRPQLAGLPHLELRGDRPRPPMQTYGGGYEDFQLSFAGVASLEGLAGSAGASLFMVLMAGLQLLFQRYSGQDDFAVGSYIANRNRGEVEALVGFFINLLPLRADLSGDPPVRELLRRVRQTTLDAYAHQDLPFEKLLEELRPERDMSRGAIVQVLFNLLNFPPVHEELPGLTMSGSGVRNDRANFDVSLWMAEGSEGLLGWLEYNTALFDRATVRRMADQLQRLFEEIARDPERRASELPLLAHAERRQLLAEWGARPAGFDLELCFHELFERQAAASPGAEAVVALGQRLTYGELDERSNRLARRLRRLGVGPEVRVGICLHKTVDLPVAVLAVLKAGGAYVPLDATYASDRLAAMLEDSGAAVLLTRAEAASALPQTGAAVVRLDEGWPSIATESAAPLRREETGAVPSSLAYVIFTSGSTGRPKGVMIQHRSLVHAYLAWEQEYGLRGLRSHLQMASFSFDVFTGDLVRALGSGGKLVLVPREVLLQPAELVALARAESCDYLEFVPAVVRGVMEHLEPSGERLESARLVVVGSDAWYVGEGLALSRLLRPGTRLVNSYGITETTIDNTLFEVRPEVGLAASAMVPIGRPYPNNEVYLLDRNLEPAPVGVPGELFLGGPGVGRGYLGRPDLTAERFVPHPFSATPGARLYRAGDLARWLRSGDVEFLGRADHQVKVRGFRIEPGEIEAALGAHPAVKQAAVLALEARPGDRRLVAWVVPEEGQEALADGLRAHLRGRLPDYMVPSAFVVLEAFPLTPNGKVDRRALPAPDWERSGEEDGFTPPRTESERRLAEIWSGVLKIDRIGAFDSFFDLGGHSLLATQLVSRVRGAFGVDLPLRTLFEAPVLAEQALIVEELALERSADGSRPEAAPAAPAITVPRAAAVPVFEWTAASRHQRLVEWNDTGEAAGRGWTLHGLFEAQAARDPGRVALVFAPPDGPRVELTYGELDRRANALAHRLRALGVGPEERVAVSLERSPALVVALLAVLKAGGAYVPLDPSYPRPRLALVAGDAWAGTSAPVLITREPLLANLPEPVADVWVVLLDEDAAEAEEPPAGGAGPESLAYLIYTSGSTGRPKGVAIEHRSAAALVGWARQVFSPEELAGVFASTSINFDLSVFELFVPLAAGGRVILGENALALATSLAASEVTLLNTVPSAMAELLRLGAVPPSVQTVNLAGEPLRGALAQRIHRLGTVRRLWNLYGPSEDTTYSTFAEAPAAAGEEPAIGRPVAGTHAFVLDAELRPADDAGELFLSGAGVARGYLHRPDLTAERFLPDPFSSTPGGRMYRTGDLARWKTDGRLEYLGRTDHQVKIRGFRVELGEVEAALLAHPAVREAIAVADGGGRLVAYVAVQDDEPRGRPDLRGFLRERLPEPMVPSAFVVLAELPHTPNGKVDRAVLPVPGRERPDTAPPYTAPRSAVEERLAALWAEVLGFDQVGVEDPFLELGGHSLLATRIASRVRDLFGVELAPGALFEAPTVAALAALVERLRPEEESLPLVPVPRSGDPPPSFAQERLWFLDRLQPGSPLYNVAGGLRLSGDLDVAAFHRSLVEIVRRHEALRTTLPEQDGRPVQRISPEPRLDLPRIDLRALPSSARGSEEHRLRAEEARRPFDLARGPLLRAALLRLRDREHAVLFTVHHAVADGWSLDVLVRELGLLYNAFVQGKPSPLSPLPVQYADFAVWQRAWLQGERLERQLAWWRHELDGAPVLTELPGDRPRPLVQSFRGGVVRAFWPEELAGDLEALARREGASLFMVLMAGLFAQIHRSGRSVPGGPEDLVVGAPVANRNRSETEGLIGFFANTLPLRARPSPAATFRGLLAAVRAAALGAYEHQDVPFERIVEALQVPRGLGHNPLVQTLLGLETLETGTLELPGVRLERQAQESGTAKFDLALAFTESRGGLDLHVEYAVDLFEHATMVRLVEHLRSVLERAVATPDAVLADLPLFAAPQRRQVLAAVPAAPAAPVGYGLAERLAERERRVAALRERVAAEAPPAPDEIPRRSGAGPAPLSYAQERLWFLDRLQPGGSSYNLPAALRLAGRLDVAALALALAEIVHRHEALRTTFGEREGMPVQVISAPSVPALPVIDLRALPAELREAEARRLAEAESARPFDLARGPLLRAALLHLDREDRVLLLDMHHVVGDLWSMGVLVQEATVLYDAFSRGLPSPLPELPIQYADFAVWQRGWLQGEVLEEQLSYWREELAGAPALLELPADRPRPPVRTFQGAVLSDLFPAELGEAVKRVGQECEATPFMTLLAALQALLGRLSGQEDVLVGSPIASRNRLEVEGLIGFFVNTLVLRGRLGSDTFAGLLERTRRAALDAYAHQDLPFEKLVEDLQVPRSLSYNPLFQVMFAHQAAPPAAVELPGLAVSPFGYEIGTSIFDLGFELTELADGALQVKLELASDLFDASTGRRLLERFRRVLEGVAAEPDRPLADLPLVSEAERHQLLAEWTDTPRMEAALIPVHRLFEAQAARTPGAVAVVAGGHAGRSVTYAELDRRAERIAARLRALGVGPEERVGLLLERTPDLVAAVLGVWKAGGAYVPLDPGLPEARLAYMIGDADLRVLLTREELESIGEERVEPVRQEVSPRDLAYLIYTSGTTGRPKAVLVEHGSLAHTLRAAQEAFGFAAGDRMPCLAPFSFDIFLFELLGPLLAGGTAVLFDLRPTLDVPALAGSLDGMTLLHGVPALMREIVERVGQRPITALRRVFVGGDAVPPDLLVDLRTAFPAARVTVLYGPTEATIIASRYEADGCGPEDRNLLGRPLLDVELRVVDRAGVPAPIGVPGELWIGGPGVARGYLNRDELTAEKFVERDGRRWYRTGDLARWLADGNLEFLGRLDNQVKIRGFRIELGEIEAALAEHPSVRQAVVLALGEGEAKHLAAYVVAPQEILGELRSRVAERLPEYMVPSAWAFLDELPLTAHGKVDRRALARIEPAAGTATAGWIAPRTPTEELLAGIWSDLLGVERVGAGADFFDLGGHSLLATRLASRVQQAFGVELPLRAFFEAPVLAEQALRIEQGTGPALPPIVPRTLPGPAPLSFAQERLWFLDRLVPGSPLYNMPSALRLTGPLDAPRLEHALREVVRRHEVLRTTFRQIGGEPLQVVSPHVSLDLPVVDLRAVPQPAREDEARRLAVEEALRPFDLERGPLVRAALVRLGEENWNALFNLHHIVGDGWSFGVLVGELAALYEGSPLPALPVQYADFALWQRERLQGEALDAQLAWWQAELEGAPALLELPTDRPRPAVQSFRGALEGFALPADLAGGLAALARREGATLFMALLAAFEALLSRYSGQEDLLVGSPVAGRNRLEVEGLIGFFVNTLALRGRLGGEADGPSFRELLARSRAAALGAYAHQDLPFERLVEMLGVERSLAHGPLVQVTFALQNAPAARMELPGLLLEPLDVQAHTAKFDLSLSLSEADGALAGGAEYASDLFDRATVLRLLGHFQTLLAGAVEDPRRRLAELPLLSANEARQVQVEWNATASGLPGEPVHRLFEARAAELPDAPAVVSERGILTYGQLDRRSNRLARRLRSLGVGPETVVALRLPRSPELVAAALGVLKAGGAYLPVDPAHPAERLAYTLKDAGARLLLTTRRLALADLSLEPLFVDGEVFPDEAESALSELSGPQHLAYVIYTSGSTGAPKGTELTHAGLSNLAVWHRRTYGLAPEDRTTLLAGPGFDASVWEVWPALSAGAALYVPPQETVASPSGLLAWMAERRITQSFLPTPLAEAVLAEDMPPLRTRMALRVVLTGGDRLSRRPGPEVPFALVNHYGPTETTVVSTAGLVDAAGERPPSIGRPIENLRVYLLDRTLRAVPVGVPGELFVAGVGLARGYRGRPGLTAERFVPDPFDGAGERLYRTGDLARFLPGGEIEFLGRLDHQVKIRGFRIELGEIEVVLGRHPGVRKAAVLAREGRLVAYVAGEGSREELRAFLAERLPEPMVPTGWVLLEALPLTANGKVDRRALGRLEPALLARHPAAPRTPTEKLLAGLWSDLLRLGNVGSGDSFFELGGHSLLATRLMSRIREVFGVELPLRDLFEAPRLADLALRIEASQGGRSLEEIPRRSGTGPAPLSYAQERLWFLDRLQPGGSSYNLLVALRLTGRLDVAALALALAEIVRRHEALRTTFEEREGMPVQVISAPSVPALPVVDLRALPADLREAEARRLASAESARPFDLARGPLLRAALLHLDAGGWVLLLDMHHVVGDLWSMEVLVREATALYEAFSQGLPSPLPELPIQYADFAVWQRGWLQGEVLERQLSYWREELAGVPALLELPTDRPRPQARTFQGAVLSDLFPAELGEAVKRVGLEREATPFMALLAAFQALLGRLSGQEDVVVGSPIANRNRPEVEGLIGFFVNTLALRGRLGSDTFAGLLARTRRAALDAYAHQDLPFERLVEELQVSRSLSYNPLFQVMFAHQAAAAPATELPELTMSPFDYEAGTSLFDLGLQATERGDGALELRLELSSDLFDATTGRRLLERFRRLLEAVAAEPDLPLAALSLLSEAERHQLLAEWTDTRATAPAPGPVHRLFEAQAVRTPSAVAVIAGGQGGRSLTYAELDARAERIAARLRSLGVGPEEKVGLLLERTPDLVAAILGVWKAGGAYVPLDPSLPEARRASMIDDAGLRVLLTQEDLESIGDENVEPVRQPASAGDLAYLIYTSGTTGQPKAVQVEHGNLAHTLRAAQEAFAFAPGDRMPCLAPFSFDIFLFELLGPLLCGGTVVLFGLRPTLDVPALVESLPGMTLLHGVPALMRQVVDRVRERGGCRSLRRVFVGGDAVPPDLLVDLREAFPAAQVTVLYGPTEATIIGSRYEADGHGPEDRNLLGRPLADVELRVIDREGVPAPIGAQGELWIGGPGVARGYLNREDLTAEKFVDGGRWYRTGDLVRWLADGNLEFLGRLDHQVKVRGFRVELGEIEAVLAEHASVRQAVVLALGDGEAKRLTACVVAPREVLGELRGRVSERLPEYMMPSGWVFLEELPLTAHGKVDRGALAQLEAGTGVEGERVEPRDVLELELAYLWSEVLGVPGIGVRDDFFALGGHSLLAVQLMARVRQRFGRELPLAALFQGATIESMAAFLRDGAPASSASCLVPIQPSGSEPPLFLVHPAGGDVLCFAGLARHLGPEQPVYGLQSRGLAGDQQPLGRIEDMAALYVREIRRVQPEGPYRLGGWSLGGLIAFEMARQLRAAGEEVALLALLDASLEITGQGGELEDDAAFLADMAAYVENLWERRLGLGREDLEGLVPEEQRKLLLERLREADFLPPGAGLEQVERVLAVYKANARAAGLYEPRPYAGPATFFRAAEGSEAHDTAAGWERLTAGPVEVVTIPGHHLNLLAEPHVRILARRLGLCLREVREESAARV